MDMVLVASDLFEFNVVAESNSLCDLCNSERDVVLQKSFSVFDWKDDVVMGIIYVMMCFLQAHASMLPWKPRVSKPSYKDPAASRGEIRFA